MATAKTLLALHFLVENILNEDVPRTPQEAVRERVHAAFARPARYPDAVLRHLKSARDIIDAQRPVDWRDSLRANVEYGIELTAQGKFAEAQPVLEHAYQTLDARFSAHNEGGRALAELIGVCRRLNDGGCCGCGGCAVEASTAAQG